MADELKIKVNGRTWPVEASADTPLLYVLANELELKGPRFGCGLAQCGSCSVLLDGVEIRSCVTPLSTVAGKSVTTLEGLPAWYAQQKKLASEDMRGGTFTISNLGGVGGTAFTPIINYPEVAILGMSRARLQPVVRDGQIVPRLLLPLSLSYDHRVIDGAAAARFTRSIAEMLENPLVMLLHA